MSRIATLIALSILPQFAFAATATLIGKPGCRVVNPSPEKLAVTWTGACKDGFAEGQGKLEFRIRRKVEMTYEGEVRRGAPNGQGYLVDANGSQYEGGFRDGEFDGNGTWLGWFGRYDGSFKDGKFHGQGKMKFALGGSYEGEWRANRFHGTGTAVYHSGRVFTGEFVDGRPAGETASPSRPAKRFVLRSVPGSGTRLHDIVAHNSTVPFSKNYQEMTPEEQAIVRSWFPLLDKDDEPPYPLHGTEDLYRDMATAMSKVGDEGRMILYVDVDSNGKATKASVFKTPNPQLAEVAMILAMREKYKPALCAGKPCASRFPIHTQFVWDR